MASTPNKCPVPSCSRGPCRTAARLIVAEAGEVPVGCPNRIEMTDPAKQLPRLLSSTDLHTTPRAAELISVRPGGGRRSNLLRPVTGGRLVLLEQRVRHPIRDGGSGKRSTPETPDTPLMATVDEEQAAVPSSVSHATIDIVTDNRNAHEVHLGSPVATQVRFGLWDNAFDAAGNVLNKVAERDNFVGADTRRFYFRVFDMTARLQREITINWKTLRASRADDDAPASQSLTLRQTMPGSPTFVSKAVMLVTDNDDRNQVTNSGLPAPHAGDRKYGESNHRTRRARLDGFVRGDYTPAAPRSVTASVELPIFQRSPDERRKLPLEVYVLRNRPGGSPVIPIGATAQLWTHDMRILRETYERIGISVSITVPAGTPAADRVTVGADTIVLIDPPTGVTNPSLVTPANEAEIAYLYARHGSTIRVFFTGGLLTGNRGESYADADSAGGPARQGTVFLAPRNTPAPPGLGPYSPAHEIGHILTNQKASNNGGHHQQPAGPPGNRMFNNQNLMRASTSVVEGVNRSKRLWDPPWPWLAARINQYNSCRGSPYTRNFP